MLPLLGGREDYKDHKPVVKLVVKCIFTRDQSLQDLSTHLKLDIYQFI